MMRQILAGLFAMAGMLRVEASTSAAVPLPGPAGSTFSTSSTSDFSKSNQSKIFFHDGKWWALALLDGPSDWYLWQLDAGAGIWNAMVMVHTSSSRRPDAVLDAANNRLYVLLSSSSKSEMQRFSYSAGSWVLDAGFPVELSDFTDSGVANPISLVRAHNGHLWIFRMVSNRLEAKKSSNNGSTWSAIIVIKSGLTTATGTTDGIAFTNSSAENCIGAAYAETNATGSRFGFLVHRDSDADNLWADETSSLTFSAGERATNELCVVVDAGNNVFVLTQNANVTGSAPRNTLYKRNAAGMWQSFAVNTSATWTNPAVALNPGNNTLYVLGINTANGQGEYKSCAAGQESSLANAPLTTLFATTAATDDFTDLSVPVPANIGTAPALMVCADNQDAEHIWYNQIAFGGGSTPLTVGNIAVSPDEANANASYNIPITLGSAGALAAGSGTISLQFPDNTFIPNSIANSEVTVQGAAASAVTTNSATREVTITTPVNLANGENVVVVLNMAAGLLNPSVAGSKTLSAWTSAEPAPAASPNFNISAATTSVSAATVAPSPNLTNAAAAYTLAFNLGAHGRLIAGASTITITFNSATNVSNGSINGAQINGTNASATGNSAAKTIVLTIPAGLNLGNGAAVTINLPAAALTNPASGGSYTLTVATSVETAPTTSNSYTISQGTSLQVGTVSVSDQEANANGGYAIPLTLGSSGALNAGSGTITIQFPGNTFVPGSIATHQVTVNGASASSIAANSTTREVTVTVPNDLAGSANADLVFNAGAGLLNPSMAGNYNVQAWSSAEPAPAASPAYAINAATSTVSPANVSPAPAIAGLAASYSIAFSLGAHGRLIAGSSTIVVTLPGATAVSNGSINGAQINGTNASATGNSGSKTITLTVPAGLNLENSAAVTLSLPAAAIANPATAGNYTLTVATSVETAPVTSNPYTITPATFFTVGPVALSDNEANAGAGYTIPLTLGSGGALNAGSGTITIQFPGSTFVPGSIATNQVTVNGANASSIVANSTTREVAITVPNNLAGAAEVSVVFNAAAGLLNPAMAGDYSLQAWSSAEPAHIASPPYALNAATTTVTPAEVTPNPNTAGSAAAYTIAFNLGARGRLISGSSTLTLTFNNATGVSNGSISGAQINGTNASATGNSGGKTITLTIPAALNLSNNAAVTVTLPSAAITNPANGGYYTLIVATSVEAANVVSQLYSIEGEAPPPSGEDLVIPGTAGDFEKPNQNRPFYHDGKWWTAARRKSDGRWFLWTLDNGSWSQHVQLDERASTRPDCYVDSPANKLYVLLASTSGSGSRFMRLSYAGGSWSVDGGFPVTLNNFTFTSEFCMVITKALNGELWIFRYRSSQLDAQKSGNDGASWSSTFTVKSGINSDGLVDAITFSSGGENYVGVGYAENTGGGNIFGFLTHRDGDADGAWNDETETMTQLAEADSDDHMALAASAAGEVFFVVKTHPNAGSAAGIGLFKRTAAGAWQTYTVQQGGGWTRPAVVVDETFNELYVLGTEESGSEHGQYRKCVIGNEGSLLSTAVVTMFDGGAFNNLSVPRHRVTSSTGMLICAENISTDEVWYNLLPIGGGGTPPVPLVVNSVVANPNVATLNAAYTIALTLGSPGSLTGGSGTITVTWPNGTTVPASLSTSAVTVNGSTAAAVTTDPANRRAVITVPGNLANSANVTLAFGAGAGLLNPNAGNHVLQVQTSSQPADVNSPAYAIQAVTPVTVGNIGVVSNFTGQAAAYTVPITLGSIGALSGGSGKITVTWPNNTVIPAGIASANVTVNGINAAAVTTNAALRQATVTVPNDLANNANVTLVFHLAAGITNPTAAGNYVVQVQTTAQPVNANSPNYLIEDPPPATPLVVNSVTVTPDTVNRAASYAIAITLGSSGALAAGSGTITVIWPNDTQIPASIAPALVTVNGVAAGNVVTTPATRQAVITVPNNLANSAAVALLFSTAAGLANPSTAGNYTLQVQSSAEPANVSSPVYEIFAQPPAVPLVVGEVIVTPDTVARVASYSIPITLGSSGALSGNSGTITVTWPNGTQLPASMSTAHVTVNGAAAANVVTVPASRAATVTVPANLANSANAALLFTSAAGIVNPATAGSCSLQVHTSSEPANVFSPAYVLHAEPPPGGNAGQLVHGDTGPALEKSNQSKLFYHQQKWWLIAFDKVKSEWALWKFLNGSWTRGIRVETRVAVRIDAVFNSSNARLYFVSAHASATKFVRYAFLNGAWSQELRVDVPGFGYGTTNTAISLARAKNGELWLFRINNGQLEAKLSTDDGQTWSAAMILKSGIAGSAGNTDALTFTANGNRIGVFYGMAASGGGMNYGFLHHKDGDASSAWTDESSNFTFFGAERSSNVINAQAAGNGRLYLITQNSNANGAGAVKNTLYIRNASGAWSKKKVNVAEGWRSAVVGIDGSNNRVYVAGVRTSSPGFAEYKWCNFGDETALETQAATALLQNSSDDFGELTAPGQTATTSSGLMICGGNTTAGNVWYRQINLSLPKQGEQAADEQLAAQQESEVSVYPNPFNPATTIRFHVREANSVRLGIYNIRGELVRTLIDQQMGAGTHERRWNGRDRHGRMVASGIYFYRLEIGGRVHQGRLQMVK